MSFGTGMKERMQGWDYHQRCIYMVTTCVKDRRPLLGQLKGETIQLSAIGKMVQQQWYALAKTFPGILLIDHQIMPDHFHGIIFFEFNTALSLGQLMGTFKGRSGSCYVAQFTSEALSLNATREGTKDHLWEPGYQDTLVRHSGHLKAITAYIHDNPHRLASRRAHPEYFQRINVVDVGGLALAAYGNPALLEEPKRVQVQCSRHISLQALREQEATLCAAAQQGAVLVSPCLSPGEQRIARTALQRKLKLIVLLENGFTDKYKPPGRYFDACAEGQLLMLAPWPHHESRRPITREQCLELNRIAHQICRPIKDGASDDTTTRAPAPRQADVLELGADR